jgi:NAD(P)-dependent dehydrogenase (short-subunit alcohol dehydrogenase family)
VQGRKKELTPDALEADLGGPDEPARVVQHALDLHGGIDLLVNNVAGTSTPPGGFLQLDDEAWLHTFNVTFMSSNRKWSFLMISLRRIRGRRRARAAKGHRTRETRIAV